MVSLKGSIRLAENELSGQRPSEITRQGVAHVPEGRGTFVRLSTQENLQLGAYSRNDKAAIAADMERVFGYFPILKQRRNQQAGTLSGGEAQMLAVGRALMLRPQLLLLDEPSFGLAPMIVSELFDILKRINREDGVSMLLVEQNASLALELADHAYLLETGNIVLSGTSDSILENETVRRSYLGY
jgi:branched-chain amino acid transport system ATP-binding protein